jgi:ferredoxin
VETAEGPQGAEVEDGGDVDEEALVTLAAKTCPARLFSRWMALWAIWG